MNEREKLIALIKAGTDVAVNKSVKETLQIVKEKHSCNSASDKTVSITDVLADYLLANGVIVPPVKVGDTVYTNVSWQGWYLRNKDRPYKAKVAFIGINGKENFMNVAYEKNGNMLTFTFDEIGDRIFLTREEAEKALAERGGEE